MYERKLISGIYFDNAATSFPKPPEVSEAVYDAINSFGSPHRGAYKIALDASALIYAAREKISELFNLGNPLNVAFTCNATESINAVIKSEISEDCHVITTVFEHNSVLRPLYNSNCQLSIVPLTESGKLDYDFLESEINSKTKAVICTHASNVTGDIINIDFIGQLCKKYNLLFILDASQTAGFLPIDMKKSNIDILCFTGHKSLLGPQGTGGICINTLKQINLKPFKHGGSGSNSFLQRHPNDMPTCFEAGTQNSHSIAGLDASLDYIFKTGLKVIQEKELELAYHFYNGIKDLNNIKIYGNFENYLRCPIISFNMGDYDSASVSDELDEEYGIATRSGAHCAPLLHQALKTEKQGIVRFSFSCFNTISEIDLAIEAIKNLT